MQLTIENLSKRYTDVTALKDISVECESGEFLVILGPPGAGKTSFLKIIAGLEEVTEGKIYFGNEDYTNVEPKDRDVAMAFEGYALYPHLNVYENIAHPLRVRGGYKEDKIKSLIEEITKILQIDHLWQRKTNQLSGGQRQRVGMARALVREKPNLLLLDEPIAHLDAALRHWLRGELKRFVKAKGITTVYSTPDYQEALAMGDRVLVLFEGQLKQLGKPDEILNKPSCAEVAAFIGDPPTNIVPIKIEKDCGRHVADIAGNKLTVPEFVLQGLSGDVCKSYFMGLKPSDLIICKEKTGEGFEATVYVSESMQRKKVVTVKVGPHLLKTNTSYDTIADIGDKVWVQVNLQKNLLFDAETKKAVCVMR